MSFTEEIKARIEQTGKSFLSIAPDENNDEYHHFYFIGKYEGEEVVFDAIVYTLRLQHETEIYDLAEKETVNQFPAYEKFILSHEEDGKINDISQEIEEEIGMFMADTIVSLEEEGEITVCEHVDIDTEAGIGIGLEAGLNVEKITDRVIGKLIKEFNDDTLTLDETLVSFQNGGEEGDER